MRRRVMLVTALIIAAVALTTVTYFITRNSAYEDPLAPLRGVLGNAPNSIRLVSSSFNAGTAIPRQYTCDGVDESPPLSWSRGPKGTVSYAILMYDPDAPKGTFYHWVIYNIPPNMTSLPDGIPRTFMTRFGLQCINDFGEYGYGGPCPPHGSTHRYVIVVLALNTKLSLPRDAGARTFLNAIRGHVLAYGALVVKYGR